MTDAMMTATGIRVVDQPERCEACGEYRPFKNGLCWWCKEAKYEAERVIPDQPERCDRCEACGEYRPFKNGLCWWCKDAIAKYEAEYLRMAIDELMVQLASDSGKADE